jgi:hypothetical protein
MSKLDHAASLISSDAASTRKATLQQCTTNRKSINTRYDALYLRRKVARLQHFHKSFSCAAHLARVHSQLPVRFWFVQERSGNLRCTVILQKTGPVSDTPHAAREGLSKKNVKSQHRPAATADHRWF